MINEHGEAYYSGADLSQTHFCIVGCGAAGSNLFNTLLRQGATLFTLIDFDKVGAENLATTVYIEDDIGASKVKSLAVYGETVNPNCKIYKETRRLDADNWRRVKALRDNAYNPNFLLVDCTDNVATHQFLATLPHNRLHVGINDNTGMVRWGADYVAPEKSVNLPACAVPYSLNLIHVTVGLAADQIYQWLVGDETSLVCTFNPYRIMSSK